MRQRSTFGLAVFMSLAFLCAPSRAPALDGVPAERLALLAHGINLNNWFSPWASPAAYATAFRPEEAAFLKKAGFTVCRLPLDPDLLFDPFDPSTPKPVIRAVDRGVRLLLDAGLAVIFDPIHGSSATVEWENGLDHDPVFLNKAEVYWEALARRFAGISVDRIFFEVMNEPHLSARENVDPGWWQPVQEALVAAIRRGAPSSTIIVTGERWGGIDGLLELKPLTDRNLVYSFHWYDPFTFTHQGATWGGPIQAELSGIPYPSGPAAVAGVAAAAEDPKARAQIIRYGSETWDEARVRAGLARAAAWAAANRVPVFCGEFGVYRKVVPPSDRLRWISDVRRSLESLGTGWCMWDYETDFGLVTYAEPGWRRGIQVDSGCLAALGLDATQTITADPGERTVADFASGAAQSLDIPVEAWSKLWRRDAGAGAASMEEDSSGMPSAISFSYTGSQDWALSSGLRIPVRPGEELALSSNASLEGNGSLCLELVSRDSSGKVLDWSFAAVHVPAGPRQPVVTDFVVTRGVATLEPRWSGSGPSLVRMEKFHLERRSRAPEETSQTLLSIRNGSIAVDFEPRTASFTVHDLHSGRTWNQAAAQATWSSFVSAKNASEKQGLLIDPHGGRPIRIDIALDAALPELVVSLSAEGEMMHDLRYPAAFAPSAGSRLIIPLNEGISYPVDDPEVPEVNLVAYGGHGICMSFWGVDDSSLTGQAGPAHMAIIETPDDVRLELRRNQGLLLVAPVWEAQKGAFGYERRIRYVFFPSAGTTAIAQRYRRYAQECGNLVTLRDKRARNPNVDLLFGAADVWYWGDDAAAMAADLKAAGMDRVLWSVEESPAVISEINILGFLAGRYDIYQDVMDPAQFPRLRYVSTEWPTPAWSAGLVRDRAGNWVRGWEVEAKDGSRIPCGVLSDAQALPYAENRISEDLATHPYRARFIDTTTASPWREDWDPNHPLTRTQSRQ